MQFQRGNIGAFFRGDPTLKAYWRLENDTIDESGNNVHLTLYGSPKFLPGKFQKSISPLGSTSNVIYTTNVSALQVARLSISCWLYPTSFSSAGTIFAEQPRGAWNDGRGYSMTIGTNGKISGKIGNASGSWVGPVTSNSILPLKTWTHIVYTYDGSALRLYINGRFDNKFDTTATISYADKAAYGPNPQTFYIGVEHNSISTSPITIADLKYPLNGNVDEVAIFSRALSPQEISQYYKWATGVAKKNYVFEPIELPQPNFFPFF